MQFSLKRKRYYGYIVGILLLLVVIGGYLGIHHNEQEVKVMPVPVKVFTVGKEENSAGITYAGEIHSGRESDLSFQTSGKVLKRLVKIGDHVYKGQVLAVLDTRDLEQSTRNAQAQVVSSESQLRLAEKNRQRYQQLLTKGAVSEATYDQYKQQYEAAQAAVEQSRAQQVQSNNQLGYSKLIADMDGVITKIQIEAGQVVSSGVTVVTLADAADLEMRFSVPEQVIAKFTEGQRLTIHSYGSGQSDYEAVVREISPLADAETRTFMVKAQLKGDISLLRLGMTAKASIAQAVSSTLCIPLSALLEQPGKGKGVWLLREGVVSFQPVKVGEAFKDQVPICYGLKAGDRIVAAGVQRLREGQLVGGMDK
jgi:multidrug efflux system membrane fusion protein